MDLHRRIQQIHQQAHGKQPCQSQPPIHQQQRQHGKQQNLRGKEHRQGLQTAFFRKASGKQIAGGTAKPHPQQDRTDRRLRQAQRTGQRWRQIGVDRVGSGSAEQHHQNAVPAATVPQHCELVQQAALCQRDIDLPRQQPGQHRQQHQSHCQDHAKGGPPTKSVAHRCTDGHPRHRRHGKARVHGGNGPGRLLRGRNLLRIQHSHCGEGPGHQRRHYTGCIQHRHAWSQHTQDIHTQKQKHQPYQQAEAVHPSGQGREQRRSYRIAGGKYADQPPHGGQRYVQPRRNIRQDTHDHKFTGTQRKAQSGQRQHSRR